MLKEYFGIAIEKKKTTSKEEKAKEDHDNADVVVISALPEILDGHSPDVSRLPEFLKSLREKVDWSNEKRCFVTIAECLAEFYGVLDDEDDEDDDRKRS